MLKTLLTCLVFTVAFQGCRCSPSEDSLPPSRSADPADSRASCPPLPSWAPAPSDQVEADLLHVTATHGAGYRLFADGHLETYDDLELIKDDAGRMKLEKAQGKWRDRGKVDASGVEALRAAVRQTDRAELIGARTGKGGGKDTRTHLFVRREGVALSLCYLGDQAPASLEPIEKAIHDLMKHLKDAARDR